LVDEVIPLYYDRDRDGLPRGWIARMKKAIRSLGWRFNADRMVMDYVTKCYIPAAGGTSSDMSRMGALGPRPDPGAEIHESRGPGSAERRYPPAGRSARSDHPPAGRH